MPVSIPGTRREFAEPEAGLPGAYLHEPSGYPSAYGARDSADV
jgi:hypothetical protein